MYGLIKRALEERKSPIRVCVVGCGWFGGGTIREIFRVGGMQVPVIINRTVQRAIDVYLECGVKMDDISIVSNAAELAAAQGSGKFIVASDIGLIGNLKGIDAVFESTGNVLASAESAIASINAGIRFVTVSSEMDATVGFAVSEVARGKGVLYSNCDGDQPGCLSRMINEVSMMGFRPVVVGNCKGFMDIYQTPKGVLPFVPKGQPPVKICSYADGSKQSLELAVVANAFGYPPVKRGMLGPTTKKQDLVKSFADLVDFKSMEAAFVDYVLGINGVDQGGGVFVVASREDRHTKDDMEYLRKGKGPAYLFFRDHHLCYFEAASSIAEAGLFNNPTLAPKGRYADVIAVAKRDLKELQKLDGIGGYDCYGLIDRADTVRREGLLPLGLAEFATLKADVKKDTPITYDMVDIEDNLVVRLRRKQDGLG